jgi:predicted flavoprotein YhiN
MAPKSAGQIVSTWLDASVAEGLKHQAQEERRSVSSLVRNLVEDFASATSPAGEDGDVAAGGGNLPRSGSSPAPSSNRRPR